MCTKHSQCIRHSARYRGYSAEGRLHQGSYSPVRKQTCNSDYKCDLCYEETEDKGLIQSRVVLGGFWVNHEGGMNWPSQEEGSTEGTACVRYKIAGRVGLGRGSTLVKQSRGNQEMLNLVSLRSTL